MAFKKFDKWFVNFYMGMVNYPLNQLDFKIS